MGDGMTAFYLFYLFAVIKSTAEGLRVTTRVHCILQRFSADLDSRYLSPVTHPLRSAYIIISSVSGAMDPGESEPHQIHLF